MLASSKTEKNNFPVPTSCYCSFHILLETILCTQVCCWFHQKQIAHHGNSWPLGPSFPIAVPCTDLRLKLVHTPGPVNPVASLGRTGHVKRCPRQATGSQMQEAIKKAPDFPRAFCTFSAGTNKKGPWKTRGLLQISNVQPRFNHAICCDGRIQGQLAPCLSGPKWLARE